MAYTYSVAKVDVEPFCSIEPSRPKMPLQKVGLIIPTCNAGPCWPSLRAALSSQGVAADQVLIVDSSSTDDTQMLARQAGYRLLVIPRENFLHGATRQMAARQMPRAEILLYLTQDAILCGENSIDQLLRAFDDPQTGAAYGRQAPREEADSIERHARLFNYPAASNVRDFASRKEFGFKTVFFSNSFAAYRRSALDHVGGFPKEAIVSEEVTVAARMLMAGWKIAYCAEATVIHSHPLTIREEFSRYFDIAVHHSREHWLRETFGGTGGEGRTFVLSELRFLMKNNPALIPLAFVRNVSKWCAYQIGLCEEFLPIWLKRALSAQPNFWRNDRAFSREEHTSARMGSARTRS